MTSDAGFPGYRGRLSTSCVTLAEVLKQSGYQTFMSGKWHVGDIQPTTRGFDEFYGFYNGYAVDSWNPQMMIRLPAGHPERTYPPGQYYATDAITDYALDFIKQANQQPQKPWFLYLAYQAAHFPLEAPPEDIAKYAKMYTQGWDKIREQRLAKLEQLSVLPNATQLSPRSPIPHPKIAHRDGVTGDVNPAWDSLPADRQADLARRMAIYAAMIDHMDKEIGRVVDDLKQRGQLDNTLVVFLSDNGACAEWAPYGFDLKLKPPQMAQPGRGINVGTEKAAPILHTGAEIDEMGQPGSYLSYGSGWANACNTPFRFYKHYDHEGGISTPLIVHWPAGFTAKNEFRQQPGHIIDLMATFVDVAGATYPTVFDGQAIQPMEGRSLVPAFDNKPIQREALYWEHEGNRAIRMGDWKLVALAGKPWELYDMKTDRTELHDLKDQNPELVKKMEAMWQAWAVRANVLKTNPVGPSTPAEEVD